ncbi:MAG: 4-aminobutyrate--2-oxoglutarate transaminase [Pseudoclavibacter sp.]|nr:4-aminobutyrate--2-oxoglutarate transaminase [Pseudoclavibacter sp.]
MTDYRLEQRRIVNGAFPGPRSRELAERRGRAVSASAASALPVFAEELDGGIIRDVDGNQFIDFASGIAVTSVGASHPEVVAAVREQVGRFTHSGFGITPYEGYVALAERLVELTPGEHEKKAALFNTGAEAVENAVKIARYATGRDAIVVFDHAFHGRTNLTMALTAKNMPYKQGFGPFAPSVYRMPVSYPYRDPEGMTGAQAAKRAVDQIEAQIGGENVAAILIEPLQGEGGFIVPAEGFLSALVDYAHSKGILFIADEVQAGIGRCGAWFASEIEGIVPDLVTIAKGVAGGMPLAAVVGRAEVMDGVHPGGIGGTYAGNPVSCAAALATLRVMEQERLAEKAVEFERLFFERLGALQQELGDGIVGEVRGRGGMIAVEFVEKGTGATTKTPNPAAVKAVVAGALAEGVAFLSAGTYGNVVRLLPPLTMPVELFSEGLDVLAEQIRKANG